jgi:hypothetical protein
MAGARQRECKRGLDVLMAGDLAADVADQPAQTRAQDAQFSTARAPRKNGANQLEKMQCVLSWHYAFSSPSVLLRTPPQEGIMPIRDMSSFVPARL